MNKILVLIKDNKVVNKVVGDSDYIELIKDDYDLVLEVSEEKLVNPGDIYDSKTETFINPIAKIEPDYTIKDSISFILPTNLGNFEVNIKDSIASAGCAQYKTLLLRDSLRKILDSTLISGPFSITEANLEFGGIGSVKVKIEDLQYSLSILDKLNI